MDKAQHYSRRSFVQTMSALGAAASLPAFANPIDGASSTPVSVAPDASRLHHLQPVPNRQVRITDDFWSPKLKVWQEVTIRDCFRKFENDRGGALNNFDKVRDGQKGGHAGPPWYDGLIYEMIRGSADFLIMQPDPELENQLDGYIGRISAAAAKSPNGYINTYTQLDEPGHEWDLNGGLQIWQHEVYNAGALVDAGIHYYRATGKTVLLATGVRFANYMAELMGPPPKQNIVPCHPLPEEALVKLYLLFRDEPALKEKLSSPVNEADYLSLAEFWIEARGHHIGKPDWEKDRHAAELFIRNREYGNGRPSWGAYAQDDKPVFEQDTLHGHAVRATLLCAGLAAAADVNRRKEYVETSLRLWENMVYRRMHITGGVGAYANEEKFGPDYVLPNDAYLETCAAVGASFFHRSMHTAFGEARYVDHPWGWESPDFDDGAWSAAHEITRAAPRDSRDAPNRWMLVPSEIPLEERTPEGQMHLRRSTGVTGPVSFPAQAMTIPAHSRVSLLLDQTYLTTAYPEVTLSGGAGGSVELHYAETLYSARKPINKGNRNEIEGRQLYGPFDTYLPDGGKSRVYGPLFWRTYRYVEVRVETADEALTLENLVGQFTAYPFQKKAAFTVDPSSDAEIQKFLATGWRTARLCSHETYMDCPFYEQLQYAGDARIQMMVSLYMTGDSRLMKNGIALLNSSRTAEGATYSRAPSNLQQYIPPFSLWWIGMVRDYWMYVDDPAFARSMLPGVEAVLSFYANYQKPGGSLAHMPWWNFVDWVKAWPNGEPPGDEDRSSAAALDLQLLLSLQWAAELEDALGNKALAEEHRHSAAALSATILAADWDGNRGLFADQPSHRTYSQQVNTLAVLAHVVTGQQARSVVEKMLADSSLAQSSIYFRAYTNATLREVGLGERYLSVLGAWRDMLAEGLTTWAEWNGPDTRSDCHAWGASPNFELLRTVAGIESAAPGFRRVRVAPNPGTLEHVAARMPHPAGEIRVELQQSAGKLSATVELPSGVSGDFEWKTRRVTLKPGHNQLRF